MRTLLLSALLLFATSAHALNVDIRPLALKAQAEVLGVQVGVDGSQAIILTGKAAQYAANAAGYALNTSTELVVLSGKEVNAVLADSIQLAGAVGKNTVIISQELTQQTFSLVYGAARKGTIVATHAAKYTADTTTHIIKEIVKFADYPLTVVRDSGVFAYNTGKQFFNGFLAFSKGLIKSILGIF